MLVLLFAGCRFAPPAIPDDGRVSCGEDTPCGSGLLCVRVDDDDSGGGVCIAAGTECIDDGAVPRFARDGAPCGDGSRICVQRRCVEVACGDGLVTPAVGEECDDGSLNSDVVADACRTDCRAARCGDGVRDGIEECDDGPANDDAAANACRTTCLAPTCGDGVIDDGEPCDNGANNSDVEPGACRTGCRLPICGDAVRDPGEACDDGVANDDVTPGACRTTCADPVCGDGILDPGERCDDGNTGDGDGCRGDCSKSEVCGDRVVDVGEDCDDGNDNPRDGCDACQEQSWQHVVVVGEAARTATERALLYPRTLTIDRFGRVYIAAQFSDQVFRLDPDDSLTLVAGRGPPDGFGGDGGPATTATLFWPAGATLDPAGRLLVADHLNNRVRRIDVDGTITSLPARLQKPYGIVTGPRGEIYVSTGLGEVFAMDSSGQLSGLLADFGTADYGAGPGLAVDDDGSIVVADPAGHRVVRINGDRSLTTIAGTGVAGSGGDGQTAITAFLDAPSAVALGNARDGQGHRDVYIADEANNRVRHVDVDGIITTIAGTGVDGFAGDGGPAVAAEFGGPAGLVVDARGRVYISDSSSSRIRRIDEHGTVTTVAGQTRDPDAEVPLSRLAGAVGITFDAAGRLIVADQLFHRVRRIDPPEIAGGIAATIVGVFPPGFGGDGGDASVARMQGPSDVAYDAAGQLTIVDRGNRRIRRVDTNNVIRTIAGNGEAGAPRDGVAATTSPLGAPSAVALDVAGTAWFVDTENNAVLHIDDGGVLRVVAGGNGAGSLGDGGPATAAQLRSPSDLAFDRDGALLVVDTGNHVVRRIDRTNNVITRFAGNGTAGFAGDGQPALQASFRGPVSIAVAADGTVCIADGGNRRVRCIDRVDGIVRTIAGGGGGARGDGGPASEANLDGTLGGLAFDADDRLVLVVDGSDPADYVRRVEHDGTIVTIAGEIHPPGNGPAHKARLYGPRVLLAADATRVFSVGALGRVQLWDRARAAVDVVVGYPSASPRVQDRARFAPLLADAAGLAFDDVRHELYVSDRGSRALRVVGLDPDGDGIVDDPDRWTHATLATTLVAPVGLLFDASEDELLAVDEASHCVRRLDRAGSEVAPPIGTCGVAGSFAGFFDGPTHVARSPVTGALYVADTGNHRVVRVDAATDEMTVVVGDGSVSSAGEGAPARRFPLNAPRQLAVDAFGNLWVTSTTTVRLVANVDGDRDADGDDRVVTAYGAGDRVAFPVADSFCLQGLALDDDGVLVADACQGFVVRLEPVTAP